MRERVVVGVEVVMQERSKKKEDLPRWKSDNGKI